MEKGLSPPCEITVLQTADSMTSDQERRWRDLIAEKIQYLPGNYESMDSGAEYPSQRHVNVFDSKAVIAEHRFRTGGGTRSPRRLCAYFALDPLAPRKFARTVATHHTADTRK